MLWKVQESDAEDTLIIVDGAAFGAMIESCIEYFATRISQRIAIWMPESFEYLILECGLFHSEELLKILNSTSDYVESEKYESWEQYFTELLVSLTSDKVFRYSKKALDEYYMMDKNMRRIVKNFPKEIKNKLEMEI